MFAVDLRSHCGSFEAACQNDHEECRRFWHFRLLCLDLSKDIDADNALHASEESLSEAHRRLGFEWGPSVTYRAAKHGSLAWLQWLHISGCPLDDRIALAAIHKDSLPCLQYAHTRGIHLLEDYANWAAQEGSIRCLRYAHENGCQFDTNTCRWAAGNLDCLMYAHEHGAPWDKRICNKAAARGSLPCLRYAHEHGCPWDVSTCCEAARNGHLECLSYAHENGCPWDESVCQRAANEGRLACLSYAHENGCPWDMSANLAAAQSGHLDCLRYAHVQGCPWDATVCAEAASYGQLTCLQYAHENSCPWNSDTVKFAARLGHHDCLEYAVSRGCPFHPVVATYCAKNRVNLMLIAYAHEVMGCAWDPTGKEGMWAFCAGNYEALSYIYLHSGLFLPRTFKEVIDDADCLCFGHPWAEKCQEKRHQRAFCLLLVYACTEGCHAGCWETRVGRAALQLMQARRDAVKQAFALAGIARSGVNTAHEVMARVPRGLVEHSVFVARLTV